MPNHGAVGSAHPQHVCRSPSWIGRSIFERGDPRSGTGDLSTLVEHLYARLCSRTGVCSVHGRAHNGTVESEGKGVDVEWHANDTTQLARKHAACAHSRSSFSIHNKHGIDGVATDLRALTPPLFDQRCPESAVATAACVRRLGFTLPVLADEVRFLVVFRDPRARVLSAVDYFKRRFNASAPAGKTTRGFDRELVLAHAPELIDEVALHTAVRFVVHRELLPSHRSAFLFFHELHLDGSDAMHWLAQCLARLLGFAIPEALVANVSDSYYEKSDPKHGAGDHHLMLPEVAAEHPDLYRLLTARTKARLPAELLAALRVNTSCFAGAAHPISDTHGLIFVHIAKAGGSTIERSSLFADRRLALGGRYVGGHHRASKYAHAPGCEGYHKFAMVRHPCSRLLSLWSYYAQQLGNERDIAWARTRFTEASMANLTKFLIEVRRSNGAGWNWHHHQHFQTQAHMLGTENGTECGVDQVLPLERWAESMGRLAAARPGLDTSSLLGAHTLTSSHRSCAASYSATAWALMADMYAIDFCVLGYEARPEAELSAPAAATLRPEDITARLRLWRGGEHGLALAGGAPGSAATPSAATTNFTSSLPCVCCSRFRGGAAAPHR